IGSSFLVLASEPTYCGALTTAVSSPAVGLARCCSAAAAHPGIDLTCLELPEPTHLVGRHALLGDPRVDGVLGDTEVEGNVVSGQPRVGHGRSPPTRYRNTRTVQRYLRLGRCDPV